MISRRQDGKTEHDGVNNTRLTRRISWSTVRLPAADSGAFGYQTMNSFFQLRVFRLQADASQLVDSRTL